VGERISQTPGTAARFFTALHDAKVNVLGVAQNGERVICVLVESKNTAVGLRKLHATFKLPSRSVFVGVITTRPLVQASGVLDALRALKTSPAGNKNQLEVPCVLGSDGMILSKSVTSEALGNAPLTPANLTKFAQHLANSFSRHKVIIDLSSDVSAVGLYEQWASLGIHIITGNKHAHLASKTVLSSGRSDLNVRLVMDTRCHFDLSFGPLASFGRFLHHATLSNEVGFLKKSH